LVGALVKSTKVLAPGLFIAAALAASSVRFADFSFLLLAAGWLALLLPPRARGAALKTALLASALVALLHVLTFTPAGGA